MTSSGFVIVELQMDYSITFALLIFILTCVISSTHEILISDSDGLHILPVSRHYSSLLLKSLNSKSTLDVKFHSNLPNEIKKKTRGSRGGVRIKNRKRKFRPYLPSVVTGNAQSLNNKLDELSANSKFLREYRNACIMCFSETWFNDRVTDEIASIDGFVLARKDRSKEESGGKERGGGVCMYVNERWCHKNNVRVTDSVGTPDIELLTVVCRPFYLPREFPKITVNVVYIPPDANYTEANKVI